MADVFAILGSGAKFNKQKFKSDFDVFHKVGVFFVSLA